MTNKLDFGKTRKDSEIEEMKKRKAEAKKQLDNMIQNNSTDNDNKKEIPSETANNNTNKVTKAKKRERVGFSFKLDADDADKLITYHMYTGIKLSDLIEESILKALKKEKVEADDALVKEYHDRKMNKRIKVEQNKELRRRMKEIEEQVRLEMQKEAEKKSN